MARLLVRVAVSVAVAVTALLISVGAPVWSAQAQPADPVVAYLTSAADIQAATRARLGVLGDAFTCPDARFVAYRRSDLEPQIVDQWYVASQLWADADLLGTGMPRGVPGFDAQDTRCYLDKGFLFLDRLWDYTSAGYFARANPVGTSVEATGRFTDDNLVAGLALLETARTTTDPQALRRYVHAAQREADFLIGSDVGLWDTTFAGGFWWNTGRGDREEGKPAQTNALASLFFARLYAQTGDATYRDWALRSLLWLDTILYDPSRHLYRWSVSFQDLQQRTGAVTHGRYFNYDQSIAIEAELAAFRLDADPGRLARARDVGRAIQDAFWSPTLGGYDLESGVEQVYASYGAWTSLGHVALFEQDADPAWLAMATGNANALAQRLAEPDKGYAARAYRCVDRGARGCESPAALNTVVVDHTRDTSAQAWVQHLQTALAGAAARRALPPAAPPAPTE